MSDCQQVRVSFDGETLVLPFSSQIRLEEFLQQITDLLKVPCTSIQLTYVDDEGDQVVVKNQSDFEAAQFFFRYESLAHFQVVPLVETSILIDSSDDEMDDYRSHEPQTSDSQQTKPPLAQVLERVLGSPEMATNPLGAIGSLLRDPSFVTQAVGALDGLQQILQPQQQQQQQPQGPGGMNMADLLRMASMFVGSGTGTGAEAAGTPPVPNLNQFAPFMQQLFGAQPQFAAAASQPTSRWQNELRALADMGFCQVDRNVELLNKHNGDIDLVVAELIA